MKNKKFVGTVMVPAMLHMFVFIVIPIVIGLVISFFNYNPLSSDNKFIGLENFVRLVQDADFRKALLNTLLFVLITVTLNIGIALVVAQMISWFKSNKVRSFFPYGIFPAVYCAYGCNIRCICPFYLPDDNRISERGSEQDRDRLDQLARRSESSDDLTYYLYDLGRRRL